MMIQQITYSTKALSSLTREYTPLLACMLVMFQAYLIAPLTPTLAKDLSSSLVSLGIPVFAVAFSISAAATAYLRMNFRIHEYLLFALGSMAVGNFFLSATQSAVTFLLIRALIGLGTGALLPKVILHSTCDTAKPVSKERIFPIIFALATGMTFSPSIGGWLNGVFGWRSLYLNFSVLCSSLFIFCLLSKISNIVTPKAISVKAPNEQSAKKTAGFIYSFSFLTGLFHSGVFVWISHYFTTQYRLGEFEIATELFIFGLPGFAISFLIHRFRIDSKMITVLYASMGLTITGLILLLGNLPLELAEYLLAIISIGFGCSQPLFVGLVKLPQGRQSLLSPAAHGAGFLFAGYGIGPLVMFALLNINISAALLFLILIVVASAYISLRVWKKKSIPAIK